MTALNTSDDSSLLGSHVETLGIHCTFCVIAASHSCSTNAWIHCKQYPVGVYVPAAFADKCSLTYNFLPGNKMWNKGIDSIAIIRFIDTNNINNGRITKNQNQTESETKLLYNKALQSLQQWVVEAVYIFRTYIRSPGQRREFHRQWSNRSIYRMRKSKKKYSSISHDTEMNVILAFSVMETNCAKAANICGVCINVCLFLDAWKYRFKRSGLKRSKKVF